MKRFALLAMMISVVICASAAASGTAQVTARLTRLDRQIDQHEAEIQSYQRQITAAEQRYEQLEIDEAAARERLAEQLLDLSQTVRGLVRVAQVPDASLWLTKGIRTGRETQHVLAVGRQAVASDIERQRAQVRDLETIKHEQQNMLATLQQQQLDLSQKRARLAKAFDRQIKVLSQLDHNAAAQRARARKIKSQNNLRALPARLDDHVYAVVKPRRHDKLPVTGNVIRGFGERNPQGVISHGVTIEATAKGRVTAMGNGRIIYSDIFRDFGFVVIVEQPDGTNLLYSGLGKSSLKVGDFISAGSVIGVMPSGTRPELYVEVRKGGDTIDPLKWLRRG